MDDGSWPPLSVELHDINPKMIITYNIYMQEWCGCGQIVEKKATILATSFSYIVVGVTVGWMRLHKRIEPRCRLRVLRHDDGPRGLMIAKQTGRVRFRSVNVL